MNHVLALWNRVDTKAAAESILPCCGSVAWARAMAKQRPFTSEAALIEASDQIWNSLAATDWNEAFSSHPRIGEHKTPPSASAQSAAWSSREQQNVAATVDSLRSLAQGNRDYEDRFGRIFIICATGKSAAEILSALQVRLQNDDQAELLVAAEEQRKITNLRLQKWLST